MRVAEKRVAKAKLLAVFQNGLVCCSLSLMAFFGTAC